MMKRYKYILILVIAHTLFLMGCEQQKVDIAYESQNGIYFSGTMDDGTFTPIDSISVSFGLRPENIQFDTVRIGVTFLGRKSDKAYKFKVRVAQESERENYRTDMVEGVHYLPLDSVYYFEPDSYTATINLIIDRSHFSTSFQKAEEHSVVLRLEESEDFVIGIEAAREIMVKVNNYMAEPKWWDLEGFAGVESRLGFYHPEKWKALIYVDEGFADPDELPFDPNNGLFISTKISEAANLDPWWPKYDEEIGNWIYWDWIETPNMY